MKKTLMTIMAVMLAFAGVSAQDSFETALPLAEGQNSSTAYDISYDKGAYFKYTATETTVLGIKGNNGEYVSFYDEQHESFYDYASVSDENYVYTYYVKVNAGATFYVKVTQSYSATGPEVSFTAEMQINAIGEGTSVSSPWNVVLGKTYWFEGGKAYMTYTATADGVLVINQPGYCYGASYTNNSKTTELSWSSSTREMEFPVSAGETYDIYTSASSYGIFSVNVRFTQPQQGDTQGNPFTLALGDNTLPTAAQKYWYTYTNGDDKGFLTINAPGTKISARSDGYTYNNICENQQDMTSILLDMDEQVFIVIEKLEATAEAETFTAAFALPQQGDLDSNPIALTPSETEKNSSPAGKALFYSITNEGNADRFLNVIVDTEGIDFNSASTVKIFAKGEDYKWYGTQIISGVKESVLLSAGKSYMIRVDNKSDDAIEFRAWFEDVIAGDLSSSPLTAVLGNNTVPAAGASTKYYSYTATKDCKLTVTVPSNATSISFTSGEYGYTEYTIASTDNSATIAATEGVTYTIKLSNVKAGDVFTVAEEDYAPGESRSSAIAFDGTYTFDDLNPYKVWLVWTAPATGVALIDATIQDATYYDNIRYAVNNDYPSYLRHYNSDYTEFLWDATVNVNAGDKVYFEIDVDTYQEGAQLTIKMDPTTGIESVTTAGNRDADGRTFRLQGVQSGSNVKGIVIRNGRKFLVK